MEVQLPSCEERSKLVQSEEARLHSERLAIESEKASIDDEMEMFGNNETQEASVALVVRDESMDRQQIAPLTIEEAEYLNKKVSDAAAQYEATVSRELQVDTTEQNIEASFNLKGNIFATIKTKRIFQIKSSKPTRKAVRSPEAKKWKAGAISAISHRKKKQY